MMDQKELVSVILSLSPEAKLSDKPSNQTTIEILSTSLFSLAKHLRDDDRLAFNMLQLHTAVDWPTEGQFELVYQFYSTRYRYQLRVLVFIPRDNPIVPTLSPLWRIAEWQEREVYDLFGVLYDDHPDLRRLFLEDEWKGFPLRKDYEDDFMLELPS